MRFILKNLANIKRIVYNEKDFNDNFMLWRFIMKKRIIAVVALALVLAFTFGLASCAPTKLTMGTGGTGGTGRKD